MLHAPTSKAASIERIDIKWTRTSDETRNVIFVHYVCQPLFSLCHCRLGAREIYASRTGKHSGVLKRSQVPRLESRHIPLTTNYVCQPLSLSSRRLEAQGEMLPEPTSKAAGIGDVKCIARVCLASLVFVTYRKAALLKIHCRLVVR